MHDDEPQPDGETEWTPGRYPGNRAHLEMSGGRPFKTVGILSGEDRAPHEIVVDEPAPRGKDERPSPTMYFLASLASCQMAVLANCLKKARIDDYHIVADAVAERGWEAVPEEMPDPTGQRIEHVDIELSLTVSPEDADRADRCLEVYDQGCIVGQSIRAGVDYETATTLETD